MSKNRSRKCVIGSSHRHGFTLIEVLVVVAIIALLIAILMPSLAKARWQAKVVACKGNLHDLGTACTIYAQDYKGYFPVVPAYADSYWLLWKSHNLKNTKVLICPATNNRIDPKTLSKAPGLGISLEDGSSIPVGNSDLDHTAAGREDSTGGHSYEYNDNYGKAGKHPLIKHHKKATHFKLPLHQVVLVHDNDEPPSFVKKDPLLALQGCENSLGAREAGGLNIGNNCPQNWDNHGQTGMNFLFADAHSEWVSKFSGDFEDRTKTPPQTIKGDENKTIDLVWTRGDTPWLYSSN